MTDTHMTPYDISAMTAALKGATDGEWFGANMTHAEGRPMTPEEVGEYVCNSVKMGAPDKFLFVGVEGADIAHFGNGPCGNANATLTMLSKSMAAEVLRLRAALALSALPVQTHDADTVERVAKAIWPEIGGDATYEEAMKVRDGLMTDPDSTPENHAACLRYAHDLARAALSAMPQQEVSAQVKPLE